MPRPRESKADPEAIAGEVGDARRYRFREDAYDLERSISEAIAAAWSVWLEENYDRIIAAIAERSKP